VGYRAFARAEAVRQGLSGGVRNLDDGRVEVDVEGARATIEGFLGSLRTGPSLSRVTDVDIRWEAPTGRPAGFQIW
jgi:acylphosphatase